MLGGGFGGATGARIYDIWDGVCVSLAPRTVSVVRAYPV